MASNEKYTVINSSKLSRNNKVACLTIDVEQDYGELLIEPSYEGLKHIPELVGFLNSKSVPLTGFIQGSLLETHPHIIDELAKLDIEFELHSYSHPGPDTINPRLEIEKGKKVYRHFFNQDPLGYRSPLGIIRDDDLQTLADNGFKFDSSVFPSIRPGVFNNLGKPVSPYRENSTGLIELPIAVFSRTIRIPLALSYIKLFGKPYLYLLRTFALPRLIVFGFHLHDLLPLTSSVKLQLENKAFLYRQIYRKIYQRDTDGMALLDKFIGILQQRGYTFLKLSDVYHAISRGETLAEANSRNGRLKNKRL